MDQPPEGGSDESHRSEKNHPAEVSPSTSSCVSSRDQFNLSTGEIVNSEANVVDGRLDLSSQGLTTLSPALKIQYLEVVDLDVSANTLHSLKSKWFPNCVTLNISGNYLSRLSSLSPLATTLRQLIASGNDINSLDGIQHFLRLERLSLNDNALRVIPMLDTHSLRVVKLDKNLLDDIPDFSRLCNLETLDLGNNKISRLGNVSSRLPKSLKELNISGNPIVDITELVFLTFLQCLKKISIFPLPCLPTAGTPPFNYRHLLLCFIHDLAYIDGEGVVSVDLICGEHLTLQGKVTGSKREFRPGGGEEAHNYLCNYLARVTADCVDNESRNSGSATPLRKKMMKALQMKEQYESEGSSRQALSPRQEPLLSNRTTTDDDFSTHSPFADWSRRMGKENADPETTDASSIPSARSPITRGRRVIETGVGRKTTFRRSGSVGSRLSSFASSRKAGSSDEGQKQAGDEEEDEQSTLRDTSCPPSTSTTPTPRIEEQEPPKPKPRTILTPKTKPIAEKKLVVSSVPCTPSSIHGTPRSSRVADVTPFVQKTEGRVPGNEHRIQVLEENVDVLMEQNELLSKTNEELSLFLAEQQEKYTAMLDHCQQQIDRLAQEVREKKDKPPTPFGLGVAKRTEDTAEIKWELRHVQEYIVFINGQNSGKVTAPSRVARISDLNPHSSHTIQLQAIGLDGSLGELSSPLKIPPLDH